MKLSGAALACAILCAAIAAPAPAASRKAEAALLKDWALSRCLAKAAEGQPAGEDAKHSAVALLERGSAPAEAYERLESLADDYLGRKYAGSVAGRFDTLKCLDLYHSKALERLASAAARRR